MWDLWKHKSDTKVFLDKSVGGEYNFFGQLWRVCVFYVFGICEAFVEIGSMALTIAVGIW